MGRPYPKRRSAELVALWPLRGGPVGHAEGIPGKGRDGPIGDPSCGLGVGARAPLLLLLLQGGTHACGLLSASWGALLGGHRGLLSFPGIFLGCQAREPLGYVPQGWGRSGHRLWLENPTNDQDYKGA